MEREAKVSRADGRRARLWLAVWVAASASACSSTQQKSAPEVRHLPSAQAWEEETNRREQQPLTLKDRVFYNLAPVAATPDRLSNTHLYPGERPLGAPEEVSAVQQSPVAIRETTATPAAGVGDALASLQDAALIEELRERWSHEWLSVKDDNSTEKPVAERVAAAKAGLALSFLRSDHGADDPALVEAALTALSEESGADTRLLAAAFHAHMGSWEVARTAVAGIFASDETAAAGNSDDPSSEDKAFQVDSLSFASSIEGPGKFTRATAGEVAPGRSILVYGEFKNFKNEEEEVIGAGTVFKRSFSALLKLVGSNSTELDRLIFLPESKGVQQSPSKTEVTNFWARYKLPERLEPGDYKILVEATDVLGAATAIGEIPFTISKSRRAP